LAREEKRNYTFERERYTLHFPDTCSPQTRLQAKDVINLLSCFQITFKGKALSKAVIGWLSEWRLVHFQEIVVNI
jgi:hypothetical protein